MPVINRLVVRQKHVGVEFLCQVHDYSQQTALWTWAMTSDEPVTRRSVRY